MENQEEEEVKLPTESITLQIEKNRYSVKFPTNGQFRAIQTEKNRLSGGKYSELANSYDADDYAAYQFINVEAHFNILIPQLIKDLNVKSLQDLDMITMQKLVHEVYEEQFVPWYNSWMTIINKVSEEHYKRKNAE